MHQILCSTGAIIGRPNGRDFRLLEKLKQQISCDGFEFMMYSTWRDKVDELLDYLKSIELYTPVMHCEKSVGENISMGNDKTLLSDAISVFELNCKIAKSIAAKKLVLHLWGGKTSDKHFDINKTAFKVLSDIADDYNIDLLVENIVCTEKDPFLRWTELFDLYPNIHFVFDTKMAEFHDQLYLLYSDEYSWLWKGDHIKHFHINDYAGGYKEWERLVTLPIGNGHVDFDKFFNFFNKNSKADTLTIESTAFDKNGVVDIKMLNDQVQYIKSKLRNE